MIGYVSLTIKDLPEQTRYTPADGTYDIHRSKGQNDESVYSNYISVNDGFVNVYTKFE